VTTVHRGGSSLAPPARGPARQELQTVRALLPATPTAVQQARQATREALARWELTGLQETAALIVSELVTNAIRHASADGGEVELRLEATEAWLRIQVHDADPRPPQPRVPAALDEGGFGFVIVEALADKWGSCQSEGGKAVWAKLSIARTLA
jgi:anti-sigma regulatory factor (Ser/Thr protein kinase)